ncbi:hypothetical protein UPYG_G00080770 [Umbra pygmaea]|uniref:Uncharacterized protein n=1 Tax=Umbra pygmaea TaxID=75934 RepID=A0ABD0XY52_UMBPY
MSVLSPQFYPEQNYTHSVEVSHPQSAQKWNQTNPPYPPAYETEPLSKHKQEKHEESSELSNRATPATASLGTTPTRKRPEIKSEVKWTQCNGTEMGLDSIPHRRTCEPQYV